MPSWYPTPENPLWCNWITPHIAMLKNFGHSAYILQLGLNPSNATNSWANSIEELGKDHLFSRVPIPIKSYQRSALLYPLYLEKYIEKMRNMYIVAVKKWGKPDIIHAHVSLPAGYVAAEIGREYEIPVIVQEHYSGFESDARFPWRVGSLLKTMNKSIQGFYAVSPLFSERILSTNKVFINGVLPNPINTDLFLLGKNSNLRDDKFHIVTTGNLGALKGTDILLKALSLIPPEVDWCATIFGEAGNFFLEAENKFWFSDKKFMNRINLPGKVNQEELIKTYLRANLFVVPSRSETANVSMLEAMACGLPVVTTRCGGPESLIEESVGIVVDSENSWALATGILSVINGIKTFNSEIIREFIIKRYSMKVVEQKVRREYERAIYSHKNTKRLNEN